MNESIKGLAETAVAQICAELGPDARNFEDYGGQHVAHFSRAHPYIYLSASALAIDDNVSVHFQDLQVPLRLGLAICRVINQYVKGAT